jgi:hypothetical protein
MTKRYEISHLMRTKGMNIHYTNNIKKITSNYNANLQKCFVLEI